MDERKIGTVLGRIKRFVDEVGNPFLDKTVAEGNTEPFHVLVSCILSLRNRDELTAEKAPELLAKAGTPAAMLALSEKEIAETIYPVGFYNMKARTLRHISAVLLDEYGGRVPDTVGELVRIKGVGRKTANLVVSVAYRKPAICVDTHVHRIMNRLGYVKTKSPDETERVLRGKLPPRWWIPVNGMLVRYGQTVCTPISPRCSKCSVSKWCDRVGVERSR
jgi:endonuclease-3